MSHVSRGLFVWGTAVQPIRCRVPRLFTEKKDADNVSGCGLKTGFRVHILTRLRARLVYRVWEDSSDAKDAFGRMGVSCILETRPLFGAQTMGSHIHCGITGKSYDRRYLSHWH
jgi:hypothetical protein